MEEVPFVKEIDGKLKIHEFEKHYITLLLKKEIEEIEKSTTKLKEDPSAKGLLEAVTTTYLGDLKAVLERVEAMPSAKW